MIQNRDQCQQIESDTIVQKGKAKLKTSFGKSGTRWCASFEILG